MGQPELVVAGLSRMLGSFSEYARLSGMPVGGSTGELVDVLMCGDEWFTGHRPTFLELQASFNADRVVIYSPTIAGYLVEAAIRSGADGYLDQRWGPAELVKALTAVSAGVQIRPALLGCEAHELTKIGLSERELEILGLVGAGFANTDIAHHLGLSINTVKTYVRNSYQKIGLSSRSQAVLWVYGRGLTSSDLPPSGSGAFSRRARPVQIEAAPC